MAETPATEITGPAYRWVSKPGRIREDRRFVAGHGRYVADITPPGTVHVGLVTSPHPHAQITAIDVTGALALDGVVTVLTGAELAKETDPLPAVPRPARRGLAAARGA